MEKVFCFGHRSGKHPIASLQPPPHSPNAQSLRISLPFFIHPFDVFPKVFLRYSASLPFTDKRRKYNIADAV
jgi:hypothetical protein